MVVISHQAKRMNHEAKAFLRFGQRGQKGGVVRRRVKDALPSASPIHDMRAGPLKFDPDGSRHGGHLSNVIPMKQAT